MQERQNQIEAWLGVVIIIVGIAALVFFLNTKESVVNVGNKVITENPEDLIFVSNVLQEYQEKSDKVKNDANAEKLQTELNQELAKKVDEQTRFIPLNNKPFVISNTETEKNYKINFNREFGLATSTGMGLELSYFISQMNPEGEALLPFSPIDLENILNIAIAYEKFADALQKLATPKSLEEKAEITILKARETGFYLRKIVEEKDPFLNSVYFNKYTQSSKYVIKLNIPQQSL